MGELILCNQMLAALPYYIEEASLNIYSLEELSFYIENNIFLLEVDFMNEELCTWIDKELRLTEAAERLRNICRGGGTLAEFVECILSQSGYLGGQQIRQLISVLKNMENKSEFECIKMKADRYLENKRYINAIYEYRKLVEMKNEPDEILKGNAWHNLGCAYAGLFFFREAALCFRRAYELNENPETIRECLYAYRCMHDEQGLKKTAEEFGLGAEELMDIGRELTAASRMEEIGQFEQRLDELFSADREQELGAIVTEWKDIYRKNCRI